MKVEFEKSFMRDLKKISNKVLLRYVKEVIRNIEDSENMKRLKTDTSCFRIKVSDYRIGLKNFKELTECPLSPDDYIVVLKYKILI